MKHLIRSIIPYSFLRKVFPACCALSLLVGAGSAEASTMTVYSFGMDENDQPTYTTIVDTTSQLIPGGMGYVAAAIFPNHTFEQLLTKTFFEFASDFKPVVSSTFGGTPVGGRLRDGVFYFKQNTAFNPDSGSRAYLMIANGPLDTATEYALLSEVWYIEGDEFWADADDIIAGVELNPGVPNNNISYKFSGSIQLVPGNVKPVPEPSLTMLLLGSAAYLSTRRRFSGLKRQDSVND